MATIRKRGSRYNVQIRKEGYPSITKTFASISVAKKWAKGVEADMERRIHVEVPDQTTVGELLKRYQSKEFGEKTKQTSRQRYKQRDAGISINRRFLIELKFAYFNS